MLQRLARPAPLWSRASGRARIAAVAAAGAILLAAATVLIAIVEAPPLSLPGASPLYLVPVVVMAVTFGTWPAVATAVAGFLLYDVLFVEPRFTLAVNDPGEWLDLLLLLFVGVTIGRLSARQTERASEAVRRARESQALFRISRVLATGSSVAEALPPIVDALVQETGMDRVWVSWAMGTREVVAADSQPDHPHPSSAIHSVLRQATGEGSARWVRAHLGGDHSGKRDVGEHELSCVRIEADGRVVGSLWATRPRGSGAPGQEETRLLSLAADQLGLAYHRERLRIEANEAEVARQSEALKSALLVSVSHDLRTPLASIRASAGSLMDATAAPNIRERRALARAIDAEAERLDRLVRKLLDMSRIEGGALQPELEVFDLPELLEPIVARHGAAADGQRIHLDIPRELPPVRIDAIYLDEAITNLLENAARYASGADVRVSAWSASAGTRVVVRVEDAGEGVPPDAAPYLFQKFFRLRRAGEGPRHGSGVGLSIVKGLVEAMGGAVHASRGELGGLAVDLALPAVPPPPDEIPR